MDLLHRNIFDQCLVGFLLKLIIHLFFQILSLLLLIFCMNDLEYMASFYHVLFYFNVVIKIDHLYLLSISLSHILKAFVPYGHVATLSNVCNLLSSLLFSAVLITSSVYTLWSSLLNLSSDFNMVLLLYNKSF